MAAETGLARLLKQIIATSGESQDALGDRLTGGGRNAIGPWLRGRPPNNDSIKKMAPTLGMSVPELLVLSGQFTEADLQIDRLPPDPSALSIPQLLDELRDRFAALDPEGAAAARSTPAGALSDHEPDSSQISEKPTGRRKPRLVKNGSDATPPPAAE